MKSKRKSIIIIMGVLIVAVLAISFVNVFSLTSNSFWEMSIAQALTLLVAIVVAFWAVQRKNDERKIKEQIEVITNKIQKIVTAEHFCNFNSIKDSEDAQKTFTMNTRKLKNCIEILKEYSKFINVKDEITYIDERVKEYKEFVSEKVGDLDYLKKSETSLRRYAENIDSKCDSIVLKIYSEF